jgi:hypothetical protein
MDYETFPVQAFGQALLSAHWLLNDNHRGYPVDSILLARHFSTIYWISTADCWRKPKELNIIAKTVDRLYFILKLEPLYSSK